MAVHALKIHPKFYAELVAGRKHHELRKNDRNYAVGDILELREWDPETGKFTGNMKSRKVTYITAGAQGLVRDYVILSVQPVE